MAKSTFTNKEETTRKKATGIKQPGLKYGSQHLERLTYNPVLREEPMGLEP